MKYPGTLYPVLSIFLFFMAIRLVVAGDSSRELLDREFTWWSRLKENTLYVLDHLHTWSRQNLGCYMYIRYTKQNIDHNIYDNSLSKQKLSLSIITWLADSHLPAEREENSWSEGLIIQPSGIFVNIYVGGQQDCHSLSESCWSCAEKRKKCIKIKPMLQFHDKKLL